MAEVYRRRLRSSMTTAYLIFVLGALSSLMLNLALTGESEDPLGVLSAPPTLPALIVFSFATFLSILVVVRAYSRYLYARLMDSMARLIYGEGAARSLSAPATAAPSP